MLIMYVLKRSKHGDLICEKLLIYKATVIRIVCLLIILLVAKVSAENPSGLNQSVTFNVVKKSKTIGTISIQKVEFKDSIVYTLNSKIDVKFIVNFDIEGAEKSVYKNGKLVYSSVYRRVNNKIKSNHTITLKNGGYNLSGKANQQKLKFEEIPLNLITLYINEPTGIKEIYCDNSKNMAPVTKIGEGRYKVRITKDKYNIFHYKGGRCVKIEAYSSLFDVILIPQYHV